MTHAEICALSQASLDKVHSLKQEFDTVFEVFAVSGSQEDLQKIEALRRQIDDELHAPLIARSSEQTSERALIYIGKLESGMFKNFPRSIEHVYTSFPERELQIESLQIGGQTGSELQGLMQKSHVKFSESTKDELDGPDFLTSKQPEQIDLIKLTVGDLGLGERPTTEQVYARILELGLELCPPEVGPHYRLAHLDQPMHDWVVVGMKPFTVRDGDPHVFRVERDAYGLWLGDRWAKPDFQWGPDGQFLFCVRKSDA